MELFNNSDFEIYTLCRHGVLKIRTDPQPIMHKLFYTGKHSMFPGYGLVLVGRSDGEMREVVGPKTIVGKDDYFLVWLNPQKSKKQQVITLIHELGHIWLWIRTGCFWGLKPDTDPTEGSYRCERELNRFSRNYVVSRKGFSYLLFDLVAAPDQAEFAHPAQELRNAYRTRSLGVANTAGRNLDEWGI